MLTINLKMNGVDFDPSKYDTNDILEALVISGNDVASIRVDGKTNECSVELLSNIKSISEIFLDFISHFEEDNDAAKYLIETYQENIYNFFREGNIVSIHNLLDYTKQHVKIEEQVVLLVDNIINNENKIIISHNKEGVVVDSLSNEELIKTDTYWYEDYEEEQYKFFPTACGITKSNRPSVTFESKGQAPYTLWFHTDLKSKQCAIDIISYTFENGLREDEISAYWLRFHGFDEV